MCFTLTSLTWRACGRRMLRGQTAHKRNKTSCIFCMSAYSVVCMSVHLGIIYSLMTDTWPHAHNLFVQAVCMCPFGFIWSSVMSHAVCLVLHLSLPRGGSVQDKHLIWPGPCFLVHHHGSSLVNSLSYNRSHLFHWIFNVRSMLF